MLWLNSNIARPQYGDRNMTALPPDTHNRYDDEINLAQLIGVLLKSKWLILGGTLICSLIVGLHAFLLPRQYQSESLILVSPSIVKPNSDGAEGAQVSEITVSSLEASTYEVLAKSDELMLVLADTLRAKLAPEVLRLIANETDTYSIASALIGNLEVELLQQGSGQLKAPTTPLLVLSYKSTEKSLPSIVVNTWSKLFLQRNQGLSSNVTDDFYKKIVSQYEQAKNNLESKENELAKLNAASNELNRLKTEMNFKNIQLDSSLNTYKQLKTQLEQKKQDYEFVILAKENIELNGEWIGYIKPDSLSITKKIQTL